MPRICDEFPDCETPGIFWYKPRKKFLSYVGYHEIITTDENGFTIKKRVRSTQYLGTRDEKEACIAKFKAISEEWKRVVAEQRHQYDAENARRKLLKQPPLERFKPIWPPVTPATSPAPAVVFQPPTTTVPSSVMQPSRPTGNDLLNMTLLEAKERYLALYKRRIGLMNGKGINENTYIKFAQNLTLALALNKTYTRPQKPINVRKRLGALTLDDYDAFVRFWCNPANIRSGRGGLNYIRAFKQMIDHLRVPKLDGFDEVFSVKVPSTPKIVRYDPELLRRLLNCEDQRAKMFSLLCLNCGYYGVDIARLRHEHISDAEGNPTVSGRLVTSVVAAQPRS